MSQILINQNTPTSLDEAIKYLRQGIVIDPANIELRQRLVNTLKLLKRTDEASQEQALLDKLLAGRP